MSQINFWKVVVRDNLKAHVLQILLVEVVEHSTVHQLRAEAVRVRAHAQVGQQRAHLLGVKYSLLGVRYRV